MVQGRALLDRGTDPLAQRRAEPRKPAEPFERATDLGPGAGVTQQQDARQHGLLRDEGLTVVGRPHQHGADDVAERTAPADRADEIPRGGLEPRRIGVALVADDVAAVLHVVVQRSVDIGDAGRRERGEADPMVVVGRAQALLEG